MKNATTIDFDLVQYRKALDEWLADCRRRMGLRFPSIDFDSDCWPIKTLYQTSQRDWNFTKPFQDFADKDISYKDVLRCLVAEMVLKGKPNDMHRPVVAFRRLSDARPHRIFGLGLQDLRLIESTLLDEARSKLVSAGNCERQLSELTNQVARLGVLGILPQLGFFPHAESKAVLRKLEVACRTKSRSGKEDLLDRKMEALNEAFNSMLENPFVDGRPILTTQDRVAIATLCLTLCAPSRINEILCMSIDDHVTIEDYVGKSPGELDKVHRAHQMLIITMKGSKGAQWSPKPVLSFMMDVFHHCMKIITESGRRSRMLVEWYQKYPYKLYLPPELEYLRGGDICRHDLIKIISLSESSNGTGRSEAQSVFMALKERRFKATKPVAATAKGAKNIVQQEIYFLKWRDVERSLLKRVHRAMDDCRKVTQCNYYIGDLSKMLFLFDRDELPFLPFATNYLNFRNRIKRTKNCTNQPSVFEKLNITIPVSGRVQFAEMDSHDPRRWLTTMALKHGEKLSDVLINKWANRSNLSQLKAYDFRTSESLATFAAMPDAAKLTELTDLSEGLAALEKLEDQFGLQTTITAAHDAGIALTSMDAISEAVENRPVAKSSRGVIILYPQRFGVCLHQHHEKPCRNYSTDLKLSCITCSQGVHVKGHLPTNDETRKVDTKLFDIILRHLKNLAHTYNRHVADDPAALGEHMLTLVEKGLSPVLIEQLATELIENFHKINHLLKDRLLARRLEQAFAARGVVNLLDDSTVKSGAMIKYHSQTRHAEPLMEIALDQYGGREQVERDEKELIAKFPQLAPKSMGLTDERHLITQDDDEEGD